ncbi:MAG: bifunctional riboflavin kinase/FAD synthetase [Myxococcota bacterium]|nr:bifunctional riboflavin kinase/FAD synthetase [Myxococcota bacterium]
MRVFRHYADIHNIGPTVAAIGNFDGVHHGHQQLLEQAQRRAATMDAEAAVLTFHPHPADVVGRAKPVMPLYSLVDRCQFLHGYGIGTILAQTFDLKFAGLTPREFVETVLVGALNVSAVVVGYNFAFGAKRAGRVEHLKALGEELGFTVDVIQSVTDAPDSEISSTRIRSAVLDGRLADARSCLGRPHASTGLVVQGEQRGRDIGFPTLNVLPETQTLPPVGVYAGWLDNGQQCYPAVANLGHTPTFGESRPMRLEVHALDADLPDSYGQRVRFYFSLRLRAEQKFESKDELVVQIARDCQAARLALAEDSKPRTFGL